jgi:hypothetical protein
VSYVKRYTWDEEGYPPDGMELVAAADYDALRDEVDALRAVQVGLVAQRERLEAALREAIAPKEPT